MATSNSITTDEALKLLSDEVHRRVGDTECFWLHPARKNDLVPDCLSVMCSCDNCGMSYGWTPEGGKCTHCDNAPVSVTFSISCELGGAE